MAKMLISCISGIKVRICATTCCRNLLTNKSSIRQYYQYQRTEWKNMALKPFHS